MKPAPSCCHSRKRESRFLRGSSSATRSIISPGDDSLTSRWALHWFWCFLWFLMQHIRGSNITFKPVKLHVNTGYMGTNSNHVIMMSTDMHQALFRAAALSHHPETAEEEFYLHLCCFPLTMFPCTGATCWQQPLGPKQTITMFMDEVQRDQERPLPIRTHLITH